MTVDTQALPESKILDEVKKRFSEAIVSGKFERSKRISLLVKQEALVDVARFLKDEENFDYLTSVAGIDYPARKEFEVVYHVMSTLSKIFLTLRTSLPREQPNIDSLVSVWKSAEYHERETHEMLGIDFRDHPNQSKLLLDEDWDGPPPLRKDFLLQTKLS